MNPNLQEMELLIWVQRVKKQFHAVDIDNEQRNTKMPSPAQIKFFESLTNDRDFGKNDPEQLRKDFAELDDGSASSWIEKALDLPKRKDGAATVKPPF